MQAAMTTQDPIYITPSRENWVRLLQELVQPNDLAVIGTPNRQLLLEEIVFSMVIDGFRYTLSRKGAKPMVDSYHLSPREQEIVRLVAEGTPNKCIAIELKIKPSTVATHMQRIFRKLNVKSRAEMVARAIEYHL